MAALRISASSSLVLVLVVFAIPFLAVLIHVLPNKLFYVYGRSQNKFRARGFRIGHVNIELFKSVYMFIYWGVEPVTPKYIHGLDNVIMCI